MRRIAAGVLADKRFVVDPQLGGEEKGETGPTGMRASDLNLEVAFYLSRLLEASGAKVALTRESDETVSALRRVEIEERFDAEWFISIGHSETEPGFRIMHYPTSKIGTRLAESIANSLRSLQTGGIAVVEPYSHFVLTHTGSPAVMIQGPAPITRETEKKLLRPATLRSEAYSMYCGILGALGLDDKETGRISVVVLDEKEKAISGATLVLDGSMILQTNERGEFIFANVTPGDHRLEIYDGDVYLWDGTILSEAGIVNSITVSE
jgi:hypothetical protein